MPHCNGRRYPNAPPWTIGGCIERPPPYGMFPFTGGFTGTWAFLNGTFVYCALQSPTHGWDPFVSWQKHFDFTHDVIVDKGKDATGWYLQCTYQEMGFSGGNQVSFGCYYLRRFPNGFPRWPDYYQLDFDHADPLWHSGTPAIVNLYMGNYGLMPVNFCT